MSDEPTLVCPDCLGDGKIAAMDEMVYVPCKRCAGKGVIGLPQEMGLGGITPPPKPPFG